MGIDAAMTDMAGSAVPKILMSTVVAATALGSGFGVGTSGVDNLQLLSEMSLRETIFMKAMTPELGAG
jgi:hypothetical protein